MFPDIKNVSSPGTSAKIQRLRLPAQPGGRRFFRAVQKNHPGPRVWDVCTARDEVLLFTRMHGDHWITHLGWDQTMQMYGKVEGYLLHSALFELVIS